MGCYLVCLLDFNVVYRRPLARYLDSKGDNLWRGGYDADFIRFVSFVNGNIRGYTRAVLSVIMMAIQPP